MVGVFALPVDVGATKANGFEEEEGVTEGDFLVILGDFDVGATKAKGLLLSVVVVYGFFVLLLIVVVVVAEVEVTSI